MPADGSRQKSSGGPMSTEREDIKKIEKEIDEENVRIVLFGQPGSGKSSLINAVCGREAVKTGELMEPTTDAVVVENGDVTFIDLPGYGTDGFPEEAFLERFRPFQYDLFLCVFSDKLRAADTRLFCMLEALKKPCIFVRSKIDLIYEEGRTLEECEAVIRPFQYDLFLCVFSDKLRAADTRLFCMLEALKKPCIFVRSKIDLIYEEGRTLEECEAVIRRDVETQLGTRDIDLVFVSARRDRPVGIDVLNDVIMSKMNEARREKYILTAEARTKEQLEAKKAAAMTFVKRSATYSAYNGLNPIIAVDAAVDFMILYQLYNNIRETFGITEEIIASSKKVSDKDKRLVLGGMSREGINLILKNAGRQLVARTFLKVVPVVGQATAALIGYKLVNKTGRDYVNACYELARERLLSALDARRS